MNYTKLSKALSHALRHAPEEYGVQLSTDGWVDVEELIAGLRGKSTEWTDLTQADIEKAMAASEKKRHEMMDGRIRAYHGHSVEVEQTQQPTIPPVVLYHGTLRTNLDAIIQQGLKSMSRQYVHMADNTAEAMLVAKRWGKDTVLLTVDAQKAHQDGVLFYHSGSVWLAEAVPAKYISKS